MKNNQNNTNQDSPWTAYWKKCDELKIKAETLVKERIKGTRKGLPDEPNYLHSFRVRDMVSSCHHWDDGDYDLFIAALLHDIVEDGGVSFEELKQMDFSDRTIELIRLCTHQMEVKDSTERWIGMIAKLVEAKDEDAWRIKLADLADNLTQSKGLSLENRRFMIEVKAPLLLRLAKVSYSAHFKLEEEMKKQKKELAKQWRYIVTQWTDEHDIDGLVSDFSVLGNFEDRCDAFVCAVTEIEARIRKQLETKEDWKPLIRDGEVHPPYQKVNKLNKVVFAKSASRHDNTGYDSTHIYIEVIEVPYDSVVDEQLFNRDCGWEIHNFFEKPVGNEKDRDARFRLKRDRKKPMQCHLWNKEELTDGDLDNAFDVVHTFSEDSHFSRRLIKCKQCNQLYLKEFYEEIDWIDGEDPQYLTYIPVESQEEADAINQVGLWEFQTFSPRINRDWPKSKPKTIRWIGR
jgi:hypothetical protein